MELAQHCQARQVLAKGVFPEFDFEGKQLPRERSKLKGQPISGLGEKIIVDGQNSWVFLTGCTFPRIFFIIQFIKGDSKSIWAHLI